MIKVRAALITGLLALSLLTGCGEKQELTSFKENMTLFYNNITSAGESLNGLSPDSEDAALSFLSILSSMETEFLFLAEMEVPKEFSNIEKLADDAHTHMTEAVNLYQQAYAGEAYNENLADAAAQHYKSAMKRINYIATILQGEVPEGEGIIVTDGEGNEFEPYTE